MSWANDIVASLAVGDVVPGKMKGLVLTLGKLTLPKTNSKFAAGNAYMDGWKTIFSFEDGLFFRCFWNC